MRTIWLLGLLAGCVEEAPSDDTDTDTDLDSEPADSDTADSDVDSDTDPVDACLADTPVLRLGTGYLAFEPITPGQDVFMTHGPQGGWHVDVSFEADHVPQFVVLEWRLLAGDVVVTSEDPFQHRVALVPRELGPWACLGDYPGERAYLDFTKVPDAPVEAPWQALCGVEATLEGAVRLPGFGAEIGEVLATASVTFRLQPDPADGPACE